MLYLELFNGRKDPNEELDDWGTQGPVFGPLLFVHTVHGFHIRLGDPESQDVLGDFILKDDMVYYDGIHYSDFSVFPQETFEKEREHLESRLVPYDEEKTKIKEPESVPKDFIVPGPEID